MNILIFGDIFGRPGREAIKRHLADLKKTYSPDFTVANIENLSHGKGFTEATVQELIDTGVDFFTSGNHVWKNRKELRMLEGDNTLILRPANYPPKNVPGRGYKIVAARTGKNVLVINLMGRIFMGQIVLDCPFRATDSILEATANEKPDAIIVDFHAEATSEKVALGHYLDSRVSLVYGTHTHVPTADERILHGGTGYISDVGLTGPIDSVIGVKKEIAINHFLTQLPPRHEVAEGPTVLNALVCSFNSKGHATKIRRIQKYD